MKSYGRVVGSLSALTLVVLGVSACSSSVGVAATIGGEKITVNQLQASVNSITAARKTAATPEDPKVNLPRTQLRFFVLSALLEKVGSDRGISISQSDIDLRRKAIVDQLGGADKLPLALAKAGIAVSDFPLYLRDVALEERIGALMAPTAPVGAAGDQQRGVVVQQAVIDAAKKVKVSINPRYGTWDPNHADIAAVDTTGGTTKK